MTTDAAAASNVSATTTSEARPAPGTAWVIFDTDTVFAEVARTDDQRAQGLMFRDELGENAGMIFVFDDLEPRSFWMMNTFIPLDIAYMDPTFRIIDILPMEPENEDLVSSSGPAQFALEVNQGWFAEHGIEVGFVPRVVFGI